MCKGYPFEATKAPVTSWREVSAGGRGLVPSAFERVCSGVPKMEMRLAACDCMFCFCPPSPDQLSLLQETLNPWKAGMGLKLGDPIAEGRCGPSLIVQ